MIAAERRTSETAAAPDAVAEPDTAPSQLAGIIIGLGGQTPLKLAHDLPEDLIAGTKPDFIDIAEDRQRWAALCHEIGIPQPPATQPPR